MLWYHNIEVSTFLFNLHCKLFLQGTALELVFDFFYVKVRVLIYWGEEEASPPKVAIIFIFFVLGDLLCELRPTVL